MFQVHDGDWSQPPATKVSFKVVNADHGNPSMLHNHQLHILEGVLPSSALSLVPIPQITQVREVCCIRKISNRLPVVFTICFLCFQVWLVYWKMLSPWDDFTLWKVVVVGGEPEYLEKTPNAQPWGCFLWVLKNHIHEVFITLPDMRGPDIMA